MCVCVAERRRAYDRGDLDGRGGGFEGQDYAPFPGFHASILRFVSSRTGDILIHLL